MIKPRIGLTPDVEFREGNPSRPVYFVDAQNAVALSQVGCATLMLTHDVDAIDTYLGAVDGLLISGGGYQFQDARLLIASDDAKAPSEKRNRLAFEWALIEAAIARDVPILAVCGGFQVMNGVLGGSLTVDLTAADASLSRHRKPPYDQTAHDVVVRPDTLLSALVGVDRFSVNSMHRQGVAHVGSGATIAAISDDGVVEAIEVRGHRFCLGMQWHPEFLLSTEELKIFSAFAKACSA